MAAVVQPRRSISMGSDVSQAFKQNYALIDWSKRLPAQPRRSQIPVARSSLPCPMVISDDMLSVEHVDGRFYSSKSEYRRVTKANGLIEVGNDPARFKRPVRPDRDKGIEQSIDKAIARING